jgi:hypothetical protein
MSFSGVDYVRGLQQREPLDRTRQQQSGGPAFLLEQADGFALIEDGMANF